MISKQKREQCRKLRKQGFSLGRIIKITKLPKTTVWDQIKNIKFNREARKYFQFNHKRNISRANRKRRGKCWKGRNILKPTRWSLELIYIISHFLFDGTTRRHYCAFYNTSNSQIKTMQKNMKGIFGLRSKVNIDRNRVRGIHYSNVELSEYVIKKTKELKQYIKKASLEQKRIFLKSFFDDEGCISWDGNYKRRRVRGYQHSRKILELILILLKDFNIESNINKRNTEILISRKENLVKFQKEINFSPGIYINPNRKNGIWKTKIEKRKILEKAINSYLN